jgi:hypothetical protein
MNKKQTDAMIDMMCTLADHVIEQSRMISSLIEASHTQTTALKAIHYSMQNSKSVPITCDPPHKPEARDDGTFSFPAQIGFH